MPEGSSAVRPTNGLYLYVLHVTYIVLINVIAVDIGF
jgi:hypothetical protein